MRPLLGLVLACVLPPLFVAAALRWGHDPVQAQAAAPLIHRQQGYTGASTCQGCHPDHHAAWARTFHATMTQRPSPTTVRGRFDGQEVRYGQDRVRPFRDGARFCMELPQTGGGTRVAEVALTVGSRRYQQYFERQPRRDGAVLLRLPILWHMELGRWLPLEAVFLGPDADRLGNHAAEWNSNCILCHNTGPRPGLLDAHDPTRLREGNRYASTVGDLGIACEACHGPAAAHAESARNPLTRLVGTPQPARDPGALDQERAVAVCGQCHGARLPDSPRRATEWFASGPSFRAGDRLLDHVVPIRRDTPVRGNADPELFALRFWGDGTPRLTAYEYQGVTDSRCYRAGKLTCQSCHAMHAGDPRGQLRPDRPGDGLCTQCHDAIGRDPAAHSHHPAGSSGAACVACHMPKIVYGVMAVHRSHRIDNPDPARDAAAGRPHACTLCHVDQGLPWTAQHMRAWWGERYAPPARRADGAPLELADAVASLLAGDVAARAVAANALGEPGIVFDAGHAAAVRAWLLVTLHDAYPSVRWLAQRSLLAREAHTPWGLAAPVRALDHVAPLEARRPQVAALFQTLAVAARSRGATPAAGSLLGPDFTLDLPAVLRLTNLQGRNPIAIGE